MEVLAELVLTLLMVLEAAEAAGRVTLVELAGLVKWLLATKALSTGGTVATQTQAIHQEQGAEVLAVTVELGEIAHLRATILL